MPDSISTRRNWRFVATVLGLLIAVPGVSQENKDRTVIRTTTRVVNVNLVVRDAQGNPVRDLKKDDVTVLDEGRSQTISFFSAVDEERLLPVVPLPGVDTYTNLPTGGAEPPSVTILLFDTLNSKWTSQGFGLHRLREFLRQIQPGDHIGLYLLSDDLKVLHNFNDDALDLVAGIERYDERHSHVDESPAVMEGRANSALDQFLSGKDNRYRFAAHQKEKVAFASQMTIASLQQIARQLFSVPGRKTLIWVTDAIEAPLLADEMDEQLQAWRKGEKDAKLPIIPSYENREDVELMVRLMNDSGVAVYPVSAEGLETEDLGFRGSGGASVDPVADLQSRLPNPLPHMAMEELASRTGGRAFFNRNDLETGIRRALDDARFSYSLAYYADHGKWNGRWRKIQVKVNRPGVTVLARNGYFALPDARPLPAKNRYEFLSELAASPVDSPQLPVTVHLATSSGAKGGQLNAQISLDPRPMLALQDNGSWKSSFEVVFMQIGEKGKALDVTQKSVDAELNASEYASIGQKGLTLSTDLKFMPGAVQLCVILRDKLSDLVGSVHIPLARYSLSATTR